MVELTVKNRSSFKIKFTDFWPKTTKSAHILIKLKYRPKIENFTIVFFFFIIVKGFFYTTIVKFGHGILAVGV